jgi:hypothetical protein
VLLIRRKKMVEKINGGNNSIDSGDIDPTRRAIHIYGRMEHNLAEYAKYYSCKSIEMLRGSEFTRKINYNRKYFPKN